MKIAVALSLFLVQSSLLAGPAEVANQARAWRVTHQQQILTEFAELLSLPNLANDTPNIRGNADAIRALCEKRGMTTKLLTLEGAPPIVMAELSSATAKRTIAF
jgi:hypothetical protein